MIDQTHRAGAGRRPDAVGVHSIQQFGLTVPDLGSAKHFFDAFGLDAGESGAALELAARDGVPIAQIRGGSVRKQLSHIAFAAFDDDLPRFARLARQNRLEGRPPDGLDDSGTWLRSPDGVPICIRSGAKTTPYEKVPLKTDASPANAMVAPMRGAAPHMRPLRLSHLALYTADLERAIQFYTTLLGLRVSDRTDVIAFLHGPHGSDHHLIALLQSSGPGLHHSSWAVDSIDAIGIGAMQAADRGYTAGWGLGRHVLGSNYFHYVRDPWGSFAEYSADIDFISADFDWKPTHHAPENSFFLWGPAPPADFITNFESQQ